MLKSDENIKIYPFDKGAGVSFHAKTCKEGFDWENTSTLKIEDRRFDRKVREALEIQFRETSPHNEHGLNQDDGQYVTTTFWKPMLSYLRGFLLIILKKKILTNILSSFEGWHVSISMGIKRRL